MKINALRRLAASASALLLTRAEFASLELAEARAQLLRWFGYGLAIAVLALLTLVSASVALALALWTYLGVLTLVALCLLYGLTAALLLRKLSREVDEAPSLLAGTLAELAKDRAMLTQRQDQQGSAGEPT